MTTTIVCGNCTLTSAHSGVRTICGMHSKPTLHCALYTVHCALYNVHSVHCTMHTIHRHLCGGEHTLTHWG